jgi:hypothetical protein
MPQRLSLHAMRQPRGLELARGSIRDAGSGWPRRLDQIVPGPGPRWLIRWTSRGPAWPMLARSSPVCRRSGYVAASLMYRWPSKPLRVAQVRPSPSHLVQLGGREPPDDFSRHHQVLPSCDTDSFLLRGARQQHGPGSTLARSPNFAGSPLAAWAGHLDEPVGVDIDIAPAPTQVVV